MSTYFSRLCGFSRRAVLIAVAAGAMAATGGAWAQAFPSRPIKLIVPYPPGGATDMLARKVGEKMAQTLGQPVVVENRPGAGGVLAASFVAKSPADGYTVLVALAGPVVINPLFNPQHSLDALRDLAPVTVLVTSPLVLVTSPAKPYKTIAEFVQKAKAAPGTITYGTSGAGTTMHISGEVISSMSGAKLLHVPYKGNAPSVNDLLGGQIDSVFSDIPVVLPHIAAGKLVPLAVTTRTRHPLLPNVPTLDESGFAGFENTVWQGLMVPAGTPADIVDKLNAAAVAGVNSPDVKDSLTSQGMLPSSTTPAEFRAFITREVPKWTKVVKDLNIKPE
ncbi:Bug family tripartite tricarboxylate transporter substrate binding protein [Variovorax sp. VNK109]|jgi:tripartite-type tricarboxylate transporter receptor subunit TctC|uniref:Bug family tripartite tricarboxylate transporter substrate binding protein n=1 Tax=Variovorax sp. VNK109 TaxID=3400919 RepID=UPI003BFE1269